MDSADYAVDPFISGIYAGDPKKLSMKNAFPKLHKFERDSGSLIRGAIFSPKDQSASLPKGSPRSFAFKDGMSTITDALQQSLGDSVKLNTPVVSIIKAEIGYRIRCEAESGSFDSIIISTPAQEASR